MGGSGALPAGAVVHGQAAAVNERALGEVGHVRIAPTIEVREQTGEDPEHEIRWEVEGSLPFTTLEPGEPLRGGAAGALSALRTFS